MAHPARALIGGVIAATLALVGVTSASPEAVAATTTETRSCTDGGGHRWMVRSVWGGAYTGGDGLRHVSNDVTGFASAAVDATTVDYAMRSLNPDGTVYWSTSAADVPYDFTAADGSLVYLDRNPGNPLWGPGASKVTVSVGDGNDGFGNCTVTFIQPSATPSAPTSVKASNLTPTGVTVSWQAPTATGASPLLGYVVAWGGWQSARQTGTSMNLTNFAPSTRYTVDVYAENSSGRGPAAPVTFTTPAVTPAGDTTSGLPKRVTGVYWTRWNARIPVTSVPTSYNVLYLFAATRGATAGSVVWGQDVTGLATARSRGQRVILSTGGAGEQISFSSRTMSQNFVNSILRINAELGGTTSRPAIDGVDFNTFEAGAAPNTPEYLWMFGELKRIFGVSFLITSPPAPWNEQDKAMIKVALARGLMDYAAPQFYDGPDLSNPSYIVATTREWIRDVAGGDASKIVVGFGYSPGSQNYSSISQIQQAWRSIEAEHPRIRGAFVWQHATDAANGWAYATGVNPLVAE